jgi:molybdopterin-containing oxidoreductase family iron-sulfur binding subunit
MNEPNTTVMTRRDLIKIMVGSGISAAAAFALAGPLTPVMEQLTSGLTTRDEVSENPCCPHWGMVIDLSRCVGCEYCVYACQATNDTTEEMRWNIHLEDKTATGHTFHVTRPCLHCQNAPCVHVCPVAATYRRDDGLIVMDYDKCIGCRYCQAACPYGARVFNWDARGDEPNPYVPEWGTPEVERRPRGVAEKCTFCIHRIDAGLMRGLIPGVDRQATPACVNACPVDARHFGDLNDPHSNVSRLIASMPTIQLREDLGTEASVYYIPPEGLAT